MDAINLKKDVADGLVFDDTRYNADQKAVEDAINLLTQSSDEGDSGADHIKISPISGTSATTVMALLKYIISLGSGSLPGDGTISNAKLATDVKIGSLAALTTTAKASIVAAIIEIVASLATDAGNLSTHISDQTKHTDIMTTEGDMLGHNGTTRARIPKGTARKVLGMNAAATGQEYIESLQSLMTAAGDLLYASSANTPARLAKGTAYQHLGMNSGATAQEWQASLQSLITAAGDLIYGSAANTPARLAKGTDGQWLKQVAGVPAWGTLDFTASIGDPGYQKLPSGLILQFGRVVDVDHTAKTTVTFPLTFPTACLAVTIAQQLDTSTDPAMGIDTQTAASFKVQSAVASRDCDWIAIGY